MTEDNGKGPEELAKDLEDFEVIELDDKDLEDVSGGGSTDHIQ